MINIYELRIGNLICENIEPKHPLQNRTEPGILQIDSKIFNYIIQNPDKFSPSPIDDKKLIWKGFKLDDNKHYWCSFPDQNSHYLELIPTDNGFIPVIADGSDTGKTEERVQLSKIMDFHQLQNLWHEITRKEL